MSSVIKGAISIKIWGFGSLVSNLTFYNLGNLLNAASFKVEISSIGDCGRDIEHEDN